MAAIIMAKMLKWKASVFFIVKENEIKCGVIIYIFSEVKYSSVLKES